MGYPRRTFLYIKFRFSINLNFWASVPCTQQCVELRRIGRTQKVQNSVLKVLEAYRSSLKPSGRNTDAPKVDQYFFGQAGNFLLSSSSSSALNRLQTPPDASWTSSCTSETVLQSRLEGSHHLPISNPKEGTTAITINLNMPLHVVQCVIQTHNEIGIICRRRKGIGRARLINEDHTRARSFFVQ
jgi:hypothetical protein